MDSAGATLPDLSCAALPVPSLTRACEPVVPCPQYVALPDWTACSKKCGTGNQTRAVSCLVPQDAVASVPAGGGNGCDPLSSDLSPSKFVAGISAEPILAAPPPAATQACNLEPCPDFYYDIRHYSDCSVICGCGVRTGQVVCIRSIDDTEVLEAHCATQQRPTNQELTQNCNTAACPEYEWVIASPWSDCSVECGSGTRTRKVVCVQTNTAAASHVEVVDASRCLGALPAASVPPSSETCSAPESTCWGEAQTTEDGDVVANGICAEGRCVCRSGFGSSNCTSSSVISAVTTNMDRSDSQPRTLAFKDQIEIRWSSTGRVSSVSILLTPARGNPNSSISTPPQYLAGSVPSTGSFIWTVGSHLILPQPDVNALAPPTFKFTVWFSPSAFASTEARFSFEDPCVYTNCGTHGTCVYSTANASSGSPVVCECVPGYSGTHCEIGPCLRLGCDSAHSACDDATAAVTLFDSAGEFNTNASDPCACKDGYTGTQCRTPPGAACVGVKCQNGGDLINVVSRTDPGNHANTVVDSCGLCKCINFWTGSNCTDCGLNCEHGAPNADCSQCVCASGWSGENCNCRYYELTLRLDLNGTHYVESVSGPLINDFNQQLLAQALDTDLNTAIQQLSAALSSYSSSDVQDMRATVASLRPAASRQTTDCAIFEATIHFSIDCLELLPFSEAEQLRIQPLLSSSAGDSSSSSSLSSSWLRLSALFSNLDSPLYRGLVLSASSVSFLSVTDPTGVDQPQMPEKAKDPFVVKHAVTPGGNEPTNGGGNGETVADNVGGGMSRAAWIGMWVGISIAIALFLIAVVLLAIRQHRKRQQQQRFEAARAEAMAPGGAPRFSIDHGSEVQMNPLPPPASGYLSTHASHPGGDPSFSVSANELEHTLRTMKEPPVFHPGVPTPAAPL
jgi:hypothetical protein